VNGKKITRPKYNSLRATAKSPRYTQQERPIAQQRCPYAVIDAVGAETEL